MLQYIKDRFLEDRDKIVEYLNNYGYCHIKTHQNYISFARNEEGSPKSIVLWTKDNPNLIIKDYVTNLTADIFNFVIKQRGVTFKDVISTSKSILKIDGYVSYENKSNIAFGGIYQKIKKRNVFEQKIIDDSVLKCYKKCGNRMFLKDHISLAAQKKFDIGYSVYDNSITIPIRNEVGDLVGVKTRINYKQEDSDKYYYLYPCMCSYTLYGYSQNYEYLQGADVIYVGEAEKFVMQCYTYGYRNCVSIGSGSISRRQIQLLLMLNPKRIVFLHDVGFPYESIKRNMDMLKMYSRMKEIEIYYWDNNDKNYDDKISATDKGKNFFENVINNELKKYEGE